jgi:hypothetical protein
MSSDDWYLVIVVYLLIPLILLVLFWLFLAPKHWRQDDGSTRRLDWSSAVWGMGLGLSFGHSVATRWADWCFVLPIACFVIAIGIRRLENRNVLFPHNTHETHEQ